MLCAGCQVCRIHGECDIGVADRKLKSPLSSIVRADAPLVSGPGGSAPYVSGAIDRERPKPQERISMARIVSIASGKGGVGKSVVAANLALLLAKRGRQVVLVDLDIGGADSHILFDAHGLPAPADRAPGRGRAASRSSSGVADHSWYR
ncbi:MAG: P-loop NTPase [Nitrospiraceae bacterium]|nr:P-loop NTPase [Nitrospiraceae bacterium]